MNRRLIYCCGCEVEVQARLTNGAEVYPHRPDLSRLAFWKCDGCGNYVGCHHKTSSPTKPLGCIPTPELRKARKRLHVALDSLWQSGGYTRGQVYETMSRLEGRVFHVGETKSVDEVERAWGSVRAMAKALRQEVD